MRSVLSTFVVSLSWLSLPVSLVTSCRDPRSSWEVFCLGLEDFLSETLQRRALRDDPEDNRQIPPAAVGVESLIVAAATFELKTL